ncbi:MAG: ion transporter [Myxococcota bacterium]
MLAADADWDSRGAQQAVAGIPADEQDALMGIDRMELARRVARTLDVPMAILSLVFFGLVIADVSLGPDAPARAWLEESTLAIWSLFIVEFALRWLIASDRRRFLRRHWFDVLVLMVPMLRVFRALEAVRVLEALRLTYLLELGEVVHRGAHGLARFSRRSRLGYVVLLTGFVVLVAATGILFLERDAPGSVIRNWSDALFWSASIAVTMNANIEPVTFAGRLLSIIMSAYGVTVFGYLVSQAVGVLQGPEASGTASDDA